MQSELEYSNGLLSKVTTKSLITGTGAYGGIGDGFRMLFLVRRQPYRVDG